MDRYIFLDDFRDPEDVFAYTHNQLYLVGWTIVRSYDEFIEDIKKNGIGSIYSLDHDLADSHYALQDWISLEDYEKFEEKTGYHCAEWLMEYCINNNQVFPTILIHSMNPIGRQNIQLLIDNYHKHYDKTRN